VGDHEPQPARLLLLLFFLSFPQGICFSHLPAKLESQKTAPQPAKDNSAHVHPHLFE
jgi:hypothetical protein